MIRGHRARWLHTSQHPSTNSHSQNCATKARSLAKQFFGHRNTSSAHSLFHRKKDAASHRRSVRSLPRDEGLMRPESASSLLPRLRWQRLLEPIWQRTSLSRGNVAAAADYQLIIR